MWNKELESMYYKLLCKVVAMEEALFVEDYLVEIGEAKGNEQILKSEAVEIKKNIELIEVHHTPFNGRIESPAGKFATETFYTSKENYKNHKPLINKWAKEIKKC